MLGVGAYDSSAGTKFDVNGRSRRTQLLVNMHNVFVQAINIWNFFTVWNTGAVSIKRTEQQTARIF